MYTRKNHLALTGPERKRFVDAVLALKRSGVYDQLVKDHRTAMPPMSMGGGGGMKMGKMAHQSPWFLPWHRQFLLRFEGELRKVNSRVTLPYWDWMRDRGKSSALWNEDFMGGDGEGPKSHVETGPFAFAAGHWKLTVQSQGVRDPALRRSFGSGARLPTRAKIENTLRRTPYDGAPWADMMRSRMGSAFRPRLEHVVHDPVHGWVGGTMQLATSPNDPVFFLHHANVDRLWAVWVAHHPSEKRYLPEAAGTRWDADKSMPVLPTKPSAVLNHHSLGYHYDVEDKP
jgi:tyrosinase